MFRWIQVTQEEAQELEEKGIIQQGTGYRYNQPETGHGMVECHVDTCDLFQQRMNEETKFHGENETTKFGGVLEGGSVDDFHHGLSDRLGEYRILAWCICSC